MDKLNLDALRPEFEALMREQGHRTERLENGDYIGMTCYRWEGFVAARRAAPSSSADELPPLPESKFCAWLHHGKVVNAFSHGVGERASWDRDGYWSRKGYDRAPLYTAEQVQEAIAADRRARQGEGSVINYGSPTKINMAQSGVGDYGRGYCAGWNDCVDDFSRAAIQAAAPTDAPWYSTACKMGNVLYNLAQRADLPDDWKAKCAELVKEWDGVRRAPAEDAREGGLKHWANPAETRMDTGFDGGLEDAREQQPDDAAKPQDVLEFALQLGEKEDAYSAYGFIQAWWWEHDKYLRGIWPEFAEFEASRRATGTDRAQAGEDAQKVAPNWSALGYVKGATVEQDSDKPWRARGTITCVHHTGALDVEIDGVLYGWSARRCKVVAPPAAQKEGD